MHKAKLAQSRKVVQVERSRSSSYRSNGLCTRQKFVLIGFYFIGLMVLVGDRIIGSIAILSRGALE